VTDSLVNCATRAEIDHVKTLALRRDDQCAACSAVLPAGTHALWDTGARTVTCVDCSQSSPRSRGDAGGSAQAEYHRRVQRREETVRARHPRLGGLLLALSDEPIGTRVWAQGAAGERAVGTTLEKLGAYAETLPDRRLRREDGRLSKANIDHLAVAASGVWVVDAKTHRGTLEVRRSGGWLSDRVERLYIGGRDRTCLVHGVQRQVEAIRRELDRVDADVPVRGALCFVGTELPWFDQQIADVPLVGRRGLAKLIKQPGHLQPPDRATVAAFLAHRLPPAS
jgi:hypothetical protein